MANENKQQNAEPTMEELQAALAEAQARAAAAEKRADNAEKEGADAVAKLKELEKAEAKKAAAAKAGKVRIKIPIEKNGPKDDVQVFINGRQYIIKRGVEVDVPRGVAEILHNRDLMLEVITAYDAAHAQD